MTTVDQINAELEVLRATKDQRNNRLRALEAIRDDKELRVYVSRLAHNQLDLPALIEATREEVKTLRHAIQEGMGRAMALSKDRPSLEPTVELEGLKVVDGGAE